MDLLSLDTPEAAQQKGELAGTGQLVPHAFRAGMLAVAHFERGETYGFRDDSQYAATNMRRLLSDAQSDPIDVVISAVGVVSRVRGNGNPQVIGRLTSAFGRDYDLTPSVKDPKSGEMRAPIFTSITFATDDLELAQPARRLVTDFAGASSEGRGQILRAMADMFPQSLSIPVKDKPLSITPVEGSAEGAAFLHEILRTLGAKPQVATPTTNATETGVGEKASEQTAAQTSDASGDASGDAGDGVPVAAGDVDDDGVTG